MTAIRSEPCACGELITVDDSWTVKEFVPLATVLDDHYAGAAHRAWRIRSTWETEVPYLAEHVPTGRELRSRDLELIR